MVAGFRYIRLVFAITAVVGLSIAEGAPAQAGDTQVTLPVAGALETVEAKQKLDNTVAFYFGKSAYPKVVRKFGEFVTNKKTNAFGKSNSETCNRVMLSALIALQEKAHAVGGDAVVNIHSYYKRHDVSYDDQYECHRGFLMSGVTLKGDIVKLAH